jgi:hypothetical protein
LLVLGRDRPRRWVAATRIILSGKRVEAGPNSKPSVLFSKGSAEGNKFMNPELKPTKIAAMIAATFLMSTMAPTHANGDFLRAVITSGSGRFSKCWNLLFYNYCATHHVHLPEHIATGDALKLDYGSNPKHYIFHVGRIRRTGGNCTVRTSSGGATVKGEKIKINNCRAASTSGESN